MQVDRKSTVLIFFINGINSLLGWNCVLAALDYFNQRYPDYGVYKYLSIPLFVGYLIIGLSYHQVSNKLKYSKIIFIGNMMVNVALLGLFIISITLQNTTIGFVLLLACSLVIGLGCNLSQLTFFAMINYLSQDVVSKFTVGTAVSGLFTIIVRTILTLIFGPDDKESSIPILVYFLIAIVVNTLDIVMNLAFCKSSVYKHKIDHFLLHHDEQNEHEQQQSYNKSLIEGQNEDEIQKTEEEPVSQDYINDKKRIEEQSYFKTIKQTCINILPYPFVIMGAILVTFILFPNPTFAKQFDEQTMNPTWGIIFFIIAYNIGDTTGKYAAELKGAFNHKSLIYIFFSRVFFFFSITFMALKSDLNDVLTDNLAFPYVNQLLFGFTNGFCINASFILSFQVCPLIYKKYAGVLCGLMLQVGIILGTIIQVLYSYIFGIQ